LAEKELDKFILLNTIIKDEENKIEVLRMFKLLNINLIDFTYKGIKNLREISEYDFSLLEIKGKTEKINFEIYLKNIRGGEIKKSVFCCASLLKNEYDKIVKKNKEEKALNKILIKEDNNEKYQKIIYFNSKEEKDYIFEINLVNIKKFLEHAKPKFMKNKSKRLDEKDILLIMIKIPNKACSKENFAPKN